MGNKVREKQWKAFKINKSTRECTYLGHFYGRQNAINVLGKERSKDGEDQNKFEYGIESRF